MNRVFLLILSGIAIVLSACETAPPPPVVQREISGPVYQMQNALDKNGLFYVDVSINRTAPAPYIIDTGATISSVFERTARNKNLLTNTQNSTVVHGILKSSRRPIVTLDTLSLGGVTINNLPVAVLEDREQQREAAGIIGMDILRNYSIHFDHETKTFSLYRTGTENPEIRRGWRKMELFENPYSERNFGLNFLYLSLGGDRIPAILDLGASISFANFEASRSRDVDKYLARIRQEWELEGANGTFRPQLYVLFEAVRSQTYTWHDRPFIITDLDAIGIIGSTDKPLMIAGSDLLRETSFFIDFESKRLYLQSSEKYFFARKQRITGSRIGGQHKRAYTCGRTC